LSVAEFNAAIEHSMKAQGASTQGVRVDDDIYSALGAKETSSSVIKARARAGGEAVRRPISRVEKSG